MRYPSCESLAGRSSFLVLRQYLPQGRDRAGPPGGGSCMPLSPSQFFLCRSRRPGKLPAKQAAFSFRWRTDITNVPKPGSGITATTENMIVKQFCNAALIHVSSIRFTKWHNSFRQA
jgi:hypothetical protein